jgi:HK97 family phage portal protein
MRGRRGGRGRAQKGGPTDIDVMSGTIADTRTQRMVDAEQYWMLFKKHPWVRACVRIIGNAVAQETYEIVPVQDADEIEETDPRVQQIHDFLANAFIGRFNTFRKARKAVVIDQQTYGVGYLRKARAKDGTLVGLERINARRIVPKMKADGSAVEWYVMKRAPQDASSQVAQAALQFQAAGSPEGVKISPEDMIVFSIDEGGDDVLPSASPLEALDLTCAMDLNVRQHRNAFFRNGAAVGNVLINKVATEESIRMAKKQIQAMRMGPRAAYGNLILTGDWDVQTLMQSGRHDVDFKNGTEITIEEICAVYSIPPSKLRDISGSMGQAGKGEDDETFEQECVLPIEENFYETLTSDLLKGEFEIVDLAFAPKRRSSLRLDRFAAALQLVKFGGTGNQALDIAGLPKSDADGMDIPLFIGATGPAGVGSDEAVDPKTAQNELAAGNQIPNDDETGEGAEGGGGTNGGRGKSKKGKARRDFGY